MKVEANSKFDRNDKVILHRRPDLGEFRVSGVYVHASENKEKVRYNLSQTLFETGQYGMEEIFTLRGIEEKELKKV